MTKRKAYPVSESTRQIHMKFTMGLDRVADVSASAMEYNNKVRYTNFMAIFRTRILHAFLSAQTIIFLLLLTAALLPAKARADFESAVKAFNNGQHEAAIAELTSLANAGNTRAKYVLGVIYAEGLGGVTPDHEKALKWFREAADEGDPNAQYSLAMMHYTGKGVPKDLVRGLMWLNIALTDRSSPSLFRLHVISMAATMKQSMSPGQIAEANKLAAAWKPGAGEQ